MFHYFTFNLQQSQLSAYHLCLLLGEPRLTDGAPGIVDADLHSTFTLISPSHQPQLSIGTVGKKGGDIYGNSEDCVHIPFYVSTHKHSSCILHTTQCSSSDAPAHYYMYIHNLLLHTPHNAHNLTLAHNTSIISLSTAALNCVTVGTVQQLCLISQALNIIDYMWECLLMEETTHYSYSTCNSKNKPLKVSIVQSLRSTPFKHSTKGHAYTLRSFKHISCTRICSFT